MTVVYSIYIFDRHTECIYQKRWTPLLTAPTPALTPTTTLPKRTRISASHPAIKPTGFAPVKRTQHAKDADEAKLIFGVVFSLRNMVRRLGGPDDEFISYNTADYKLHYYETPTSMKFVMLTDTKTSNLRVVLHQIWANLYLEYVIKNPLAPVEHPGGVGVNNEMFELGLDRFVTQVINQQAL